MAVKKTVEQSSDWRMPKVQGKRFVLAGRMYPSYREQYREAIQAEGGSMVERVTVSLDFVLVHDRSAGAPPTAEKEADRLNRTKGASIRVLDGEEFWQLLALSREEALAMLHAGAEGVARWERWRGERHSVFPRRPMLLPDLRGADFRKAVLHGVDFWGVPLDEADFRDADLTKASLPPAKRLRCDGARLAEASLGDQKEGRFIQADLNGAYLRNLTRCDFTGGNLEKAHIEREKCVGVIFRRAKFCQADLSESQFRDADFTSADLSRANLEEAVFSGAHLTRARLDDAFLERCDLTKAGFNRASLIGVALAGACLRNADLRNADLRGANLANADLRGARLDRANFEKANLRGARIDEAAARKARGIDLSQCQGAVIGPNLRALQEIAGRCDWLKTEAVLEFPDVRLHLEVGKNKQETWTHWERFPAEGQSRGWDNAASLNKAMVRLANHWPGGELRLESITIEHRKAPRAKELPALAVAAWYEVFGLAVLGADDAAQQAETKEQREQRLREEFLAELRGGPDGVRRWNARSHSRELATLCPSFAGSDLAGADLTETYFYKLDFQNSRFDRATLRRSKIWWQGNFRGTSFRQADLTEVNWESADFTRAVFDGATLTNGRFESCNFIAAGFRNSNLHGVRFRAVNLCGADLSSADLTDTQFEWASFDEHTHFPPGFVLPDGLRWCGQGADPRTRIKPASRLSFDEFLKRLPQHVEAARLDKALKMLKTDRFQLYSRVDKKALIGVVKSQTNPDLIYSCRLATDGAFACCTQNMNLCGGLRGTVCKHLLVLIVGLTKGGELNPAWADAWVRASRYHYPQLEQEELAEAFLQYKGAEAGAIDWRPTETIPEDYYAL